MLKYASQYHREFAALNERCKKAMKDMPSYPDFIQRELEAARALAEAAAERRRAAEIRVEAKKKRNATKQAMRDLYLKHGDALLQCAAPLREMVARSYAVLANIVMVLAKLLEEHTASESPSVPQRGQDTPSMSVGGSESADEDTENIKLQMRKESCDAHEEAKEEDLKWHDFTAEGIEAEGLEDAQTCETAYSSGSEQVEE